MSGAKINYAFKGLCIEKTQSFFAGVNIWPQKADIHQLHYVSLQLLTWNTYMYSAQKKLQSDRLSSWLPTWILVMQKFQDEIYTSTCASCITVPHLFAYSEPFACD